MSIWAYDNRSRDPESVWTRGVCKFCNTPLRGVYSRAYQLSIDSYQHESIERCSLCGWWKGETYQDITVGVRDSSRQITRRRTRFGSCGCLRELDLTDLQTPITEIRDYLVAKYEARYRMHPRLFEETVASVFGSLGYHSTATAYVGDDGIDVILNKGNSQVGVQVKRYKNSISVEQIRSLAGALVLGGMTKGIFVTTHVFQSGARDTVERLSTRGYKIELLDAQRFYDRLTLAQESLDRSLSDLDTAACLSGQTLISEDKSAMSFELLR
jgi:restriction system protein